MNQDNNRDNHDENENFADLLESYGSGMSENIEVGDKVQGKIIAIGSDSVFVDTGTKVDGAVDRAELLDDEKNLPYKTGDVLDLFVVSVNENEMILSRTMSGVGGARLLRDAYMKKVPVEGKVRETCKGGFKVEVMKQRAFCPISQIDLKYVEDPTGYVGETFSFMITRFEENGRNIVVSRRDILSREQKKLEKAFFENLKEGDNLPGTVTRVMPYGAFIELIPGVEGMAHVSELSWSRLDKAEDGVKPGDQVEVKVLRIEPGEKKDRKKIALSVKQVSGDPWEQVSGMFSTGDKVRGKVTRCANFGAFVEISPGIEGLVHISEMSYKKRILKPEDVVRPGDSVDVLVKEMDVENRKISLSIRDAEGDPWIDVPEKYSVGQVYKGIVEKRERFGHFVKLEVGITGLLPKSNFTKAAKPSDIEKLREGGTVEVMIESIDVRERRISLAPGDAGEAGDWKQYAGAGNQSVGSLGEKLQAALNQKKNK